MEKDLVGTKVKDRKEKRDMKKKRVRRAILGCMLTAAMLVSMTGCGNDGSKKESAEEAKNQVYSAVRMVDGAELEGDIGPICAVGDIIYISTSEWPEETYAGEEAVESVIEPREQEGETEEGVEQEGTPQEEADEMVDEPAVEDNETAVDEEMLVPDTEGEVITEETTMISRIYKYNAKDDVLEKMIEEQVDGNAYLNNFVANKAGNLYMFYNGYDMENDVSTYSIRVLDANGQQVNTLNIVDVLEGEDSYLSTLLVDEADNIFLQGDANIYVLDANGQKQFTVPVADGWIVGMALTKDGEAVVEISTQEGYEARRIDLSKKAFSESYKMAQSLSGGTYMINGVEGGAYDFFYGGSNGLYGFDMKAETGTKVLDWMYSDVDVSNITAPIALSDGSFAYGYNDYWETAEGSAIYHLTKVDPADVVEKTTVTYGGLYVDENIRSQALKFNKSQNKYRVVIKDYSEEEDPITKMNADLAAGIVPDILDMSSVSSESYISKGMLVDLYTLMENDTEVKKEDFIENILKLLETDGKLYHISPTFGINTLLGRTSDVGNLEHFTIQDLMDLEASKPEATAALHMTTNTGLLSEICYSNYNDYINWETGECNFNSEDFVKLMEYCAKYPNEEDLNWDEIDSLPTAIQSGQAFLASVYSLTYEELKLYNAMFGGDISFINYPSTKFTGPSASFYMDLGIYAKAESKDGAWEFLKILLTKDYLCASRYNYFSGFPLRKDALEHEIKKYSATTTYTDEYGNEIEPLQSSWGYDDFEVEIHPLNEAEVAKLRELIASVDHVTVYNEQIMEIISEESGAYFSGEKTAKDVAEIIQNRVSTYVNENR